MGGGPNPNEVAQQQKEQEALKEATFGKRLEQVRKARAEDLAEGRTRGEEVFKEGALGRMSEGYSPEEKNALRDSAIPEIDRSAQGSLRSLALQQAKSGVRGPMAGAQAASILKAADSAKAGEERNLFLKEADLKRGAQQFNIGQQNKETFGKLSTELGFGSLGAGERAGIMEQLTGEQQAAAAAKMPTGKK